MFKKELLNCNSFFLFFLIVDLSAEGMIVVDRRISLVKIWSLEEYFYLI